MRTLFHIESIDSEIIPQFEEYHVTLRSPALGRIVVCVEAEGPYLAAGMAEVLHPDCSATAVDGVAIIGRCIRCRGRVFETDARRLVRAGLVCEDCLWSNL